LPGRGLEIRTLQKMPCKEAYYVVARIDDPERIDDFWTYYCRVVLRAIYRLCTQQGAAPVDDFTEMAEACERMSGSESPSQPFDETVCSTCSLR
jgi:hypothetical protein